MDKIRQKPKNILVSIDGTIDSIVNTYLLKKQNFKCFGVNFVLEDESLEVFNLFFNNHEKNQEQISKVLDVSIKKIDVSLHFRAQVVDVLLSCLMTGESYNLEHEIEQFTIRMLDHYKKGFNTQFISRALSAKVLEGQKYQSFDIIQGAQGESEQSGFLAGFSDDLLKSLIIGISDLRSSEIEKVFSVIGLDAHEMVKGPKNTTVLELFSNKNFLDFLNLNIPAHSRKEGPIIDNQTNNVVGEHQGLYRYQVGMKHFPIKNKVESFSEAAKSVVKIIGNENTLVVDNLSVNLPGFKCIKLKHLELSSGVDLDFPLECFMRTQRGHELTKINLYFKANQYALADFDEVCNEVLARGQIVYLYTSKNQKAKLLGSALVDQTGEICGDIFLESPFGILERKHIEKYRNATAHKTVNYL